MQEEVENRTLTLIVSGTKFTGRLFKAAVSKYMAHRKEKKLEKQRSRDSPVTPKGKQTVKQLIGQNQGVSNIEINDPSIRDFERIARKYGVDYAVKKDRSASPPKYLIFFKARDADVLTVFRDYLGQDPEEEVLPCRRGYVRISWNSDSRYCVDGVLCRTPEELFDLLLQDYWDFELIRRTQGRREATAADEEAVDELCQPYLDWRKEAQK